MQTMKSKKPLNETQQAVDAFLATLPGFMFEAFYTGEQTRDDWTCDGWRISIRTNVVNVQTFDYFTGTGHREAAPGSIRPKNYMDDVQGRKSVMMARWEAANLRAVFPHVADVLCSLLLDSGARNECFADWCSNYGYDVDSRKAFSIYEACCENAFKLAKMFNGEQIKTLSVLLEDY
jgi:hypothetical protein